MIVLQIHNHSKDLVNKKMIGKMKGEVQGKIVNEFVRLKSKIYSLVLVDRGENRKAKHVNKNIFNGIRYKEYVDVLFGKGLIRHDMKRIQSKMHRIGTYDVCKVSLSCFK